MELSKRLQAVANLVTEGLVVADVGTDHGYIPIYLAQTNRCETAIVAYGLSTRITTRLSDGVKALSIGECECVVIAGMGGALTIRIMEEGKEIFRNLKEFVLQPQSELKKVRQYLQENNYCVIAEDMVLDDGKFYPMMKVINGKSPDYTVVELRYGKKLLAQEVLSKEMILKKLESEAGEHIESRICELKGDIKFAKEALSVYL